VERWDNYPNLWINQWKGGITFTFVSFIALLMSFMLLLDNVSHETLLLVTCGTISDHYLLIDIYYSEITVNHVPHETYN
jgi:hypothetical protein